MNLKINRNSETPVYLQIACSIKDMIESDELVYGYKLPPERQLASELGVHRNTVVKAYRELVAEGYVVASREAPKGYFVQGTVSSWNFSQRFFPLEKMISYNYNEREKLFQDIFLDSAKEGYISLGGIVMNTNLIPIEVLRRIVEKSMHVDEKGRMVSLYRDDMGRLKKNICNILAKENMYINSKNIQIVSETNQALYHLMTLYLSSGDSVIVEEPILPDNASVFRNKGINIVCVPMEKDGMNLEILEKQIQRTKPKFIYTMPNFHNPTGIVMSLEKRIKLLEIAHQYGVPIIEEDSQRDFRYTDERIASLYSLDQCKSVVYIDSFTLTFPYGVKVGYVVGPYDLVDVLGRFITVTETHVSNIGAFILSEFMEDDIYEDYIKSLADYYKHKRDLLCQELRKIEDKGITFNEPKGGILLWCTLDENINERKLFMVAKKRKLLIMPGCLFYPHGYQGCGHLRLCFSDIPDEDIIEGVKILGEALEESKI